MTAIQSLHCFIINTLTGINLCGATYKLPGTGTAAIYALLTSEENAVLTAATSAQLRRALPGGFTATRVFWNPQDAGAAPRHLSSPLPRPSLPALPNLAEGVSYMPRTAKHAHIPRRGEAGAGRRCSRLPRQQQIQGGSSGIPPDLLSPTSTSRVSVRNGSGASLHRLPRWAQRGGEVVEPPGPSPARSPPPAGAGDRPGRGQ